MKRYIRKGAALFLAAAVTFSLPLTAMAESPAFAHDEATWAMLRDNVMEYGELQMLVEEYNPYYANNLTTFTDGKSRKDAREVRDEKYNDALDLMDSSDDLRSQAEDIKDSLEEMNAMVTLLPMIDAGSQKQISSGVTSLASAYAGLLSAANMLGVNATQTRQQADASYEDTETEELTLKVNQTAIIMQTQALFASYNQVRKSIGTMQKSLELSRAQADATARRAGQGLATQAEILSAQAAAEKLSATISSTEASAEQLRQQLMLATGWKSDGQPEIRDIPAADMARVDSMNPEADAETALAANVALQKDRKLLSNMAEGSADRANQERTIANEEQNIRASVRNLYNDALQKRVALMAAEAALTTENKNLSSAQQKFGLGLISRLELLSAENNFAARQIDRETANMNLQQAIEKYEWALKGYLQ